MIVEPPYYDRTVKEIRETIEEHITEAERTLNEMEVIKREFNKIRLTIKVCPFCDGNMFDVSPLLKLKLYNCTGNPATMLGFKIATSSEKERYPTSLECQNCYCFLTSEPDSKSQAWTREIINPKAKNFANVLLKTFPFIDKVVYETDGTNRNWLLLIEKCWYCFSGETKDISKRLSIKN
jgi:hypothetical protein